MTSTELEVFLMNDGNPEFTVRRMLPDVSSFICFNVDIKNKRKLIRWAYVRTVNQG